ncbi:MAG: hypothetical protein H9534_09330 [Dolichospermum circinale Clear-D4]|nr:hypothetical protein [Dolichospermum circinale Clear-D4]
MLGCVSVALLQAVRLKLGKIGVIVSDRHLRIRWESDSLKLGGWER